MANEVLVEQIKELMDRLEDSASIQELQEHLAAKPGAKIPLAQVTVNEYDDYLDDGITYEELHAHMVAAAKIANVDDTFGFTQFEHCLVKEVSEETYLPGGHGLSGIYG